MQTSATIRTLNRLVQSCRDTQAISRACATDVTHAELRALLSERSEEWARQGDELQALVLLLGGEPVTGPGIVATALCFWRSTRTLVLGTDDRTVLQEWCAAHSAAQASFETALSGYLPERIRRTVSLQQERIRYRAQQIEGLLLHYAGGSAGA